MLGSRFSARAECNMCTLCPAGHKLVNYSYTAARLFCDVDGCGRPIKRGESHPACHIEGCDFDMCNTCSEGAAPPRQEGRACNSGAEAAQHTKPKQPETLEQRLARLEKENAELRTKLKSKAASGARVSDGRGRGKGAAAQQHEPAVERPAELAGSEVSKLEYERLRTFLVEHLEPTMQKRPKQRAALLDLLILHSSKEERAQLRERAAVLQERYVAIDWAVKKIVELGYTAKHCADLVCNEHLSVQTQRNINDRFRYHKNAEGKAEKIVLCRPPDIHAAGEGTINPLIRDSNREQGIYERIIHVPAPFRNDKQIADAIHATYADRELHLTVPTRDGGCSGAAFEIADSARDVFRQVKKDNNLRPLKLWPFRRLQLVFDKLNWSSQRAVTRWNVRTPDTVRDHNSTRYGRDMITYTGDDSWEWLSLAVRFLDR